MSGGAMSVDTQFKDTTGGFLGLGNFNKIRSNPFRFLLDREKEQGGIAFFRLGSVVDIYLVTQPDYIREILVKHWEKTVKWRRIVTASSRVAPYNITILEGAIWKKHRKLLTPAFHTQRIKAYLALMSGHTVRMIQGWEDDQIYDMSQMITRATLGIIGEILFDIPDIEQDSAQLTQAFDVLLAQLIVEAGSLFVAPKWLPLERNKRERAARDHLVAYLDQRIQQRRAEGVDHGDVLSALLESKDADTGESLTNDEVRDELYSLFIAGHETTSLLAQWTLYMLAKHPDIQTRLHQEAVSVMGDEAITLEGLESLTFTDCVIKETLRTYPPAWSLFLRTVIEDIPLDDHVIPKGGVLYISPYVQHHLPQYWENPDVFDPSRFEGDWKSKIPAYAYMPFGGGPRVCLGSHMAEMEAKVILATVIKDFSVELAEPDQEIYKNGAFTLRPYPNMPLRIRKRA
jgi:cytochrome P450